MLCIISEYEIWYVMMASVNVNEIIWIWIKYDMMVFINENKII